MPGFVVGHPVLYAVPWPLDADQRPFGLVERREQLALQKAATGERVEEELERAAREVGLFFLTHFEEFTEEITDRHTSLFAETYFSASSFSV